MLNFTNLVTNIIFEVKAFDPNTIVYPPGPQWLVDILKKHKDLGLGEVKDADLKRIFQIAVKGYISGQDARTVQKDILILDVIKNLWDKAKDPKPPKVLEDFLKNKTVNEEGQKELNAISRFNDKKQWEVTNASVANALQIQPGKSRISYFTQAASSLAAAAGAKLYG